MVILDVGVYRRCSGVAGMVGSSWHHAADIQRVGRNSMVGVGGRRAAGSTVLAVFLTAGRTEAAVFSALTVTGGAICSLLLDQFGLLGFDPYPISWNRAIGVALLIDGTVLVAR